MGAAPSPRSPSPDARSPPMRSPGSRHGRSPPPQRYRRERGPASGGPRSLSPGEMGEAGRVTAGRRGAPDLGVEGAVGRLGSLRVAPGRGRPSPGRHLGTTGTREDGGGGGGEGGGRGEQHRGPAQRAGVGGWEPWPWGWRMAGSVGERVKELRWAGGGLARPGERKEAEEERRGEHPARRVCRGPLSPGKRLAGLETAGDGAVESPGSRRGSARLCVGSTGSTVPAAQCMQAGRAARICLQRQPWGFPRCDGVPGAGVCSLCRGEPCLLGPPPRSPPALPLPRPP